MLTESTLFGDRDKVQIAIDRIHAFCDGKRVLCAFSGGKDSQTCYHLLKAAGVPFRAQYSITRFEPPELLRFIRAHYPDVTFRRAYKLSLIDDIKLHGLPSMWARWCCKAKHIKTEGYDITVIGVRWEESAARRSNWKMMGYKPDHTAYLCPVIDWTSRDVWEYLGALPHCSLYDATPDYCAMDRIGCVCCPLAPRFIEDHVKRWPKTAAMLRKGSDAFVDRMRWRGWVTAARKTCADWHKAASPEAEYWRRWVTTGQTAQNDGPKQDGQMCLFDGTGFSEADGAEEE